MFEEMKRDVDAVLRRDPAARSKAEVVLCYPDVWAIWGHRVSHKLWTSNYKLAARFLSQAMRWATGIEIHPGATIGSGLFIDHGMGVVIGETAEIGEDVTLFQGVTLGGTSLAKGKRHPTIGDDVVVGAGAKVLGAIEIGEGSRVGANAVVVRPVPPGTVVVGVPGEIVKPKAERKARHVPDLDHDQLPDVLADAIAELSARVADVERAEAERREALDSQAEMFLDPDYEVSI
jgi:serine O-acetyltransferase